MSCPTCDHTMEGIENCAWWCPRCGTLVVVQDNFYTPKLVERCRQYADMTIHHETSVVAWRMLGIAESINPPKDR